MNNDRELLELAARAAGITINWKRPYVSLGDFAQAPDWNPLTNDGDALRLAVAVSAWPVRGRVIPGDWSESNFIRVVVNNIRFDEFFTDDPLAATRRAITRAAAEIGKAMG